MIYEYRTVPLDGGDNLQDKLNREGSEGFSLVTTHSGALIFMRPVDDDRERIGEFVDCLAEREPSPVEKALAERMARQLRGVVTPPLPALDALDGEEASDDLL